MKNYNKLLLPFAIFGAFAIGTLVHFHINKNVKLTYQQVLDNFRQRVETCQNLGYKWDGEAPSGWHDLCGDSVQDYADVFGAYNPNPYWVNGRLHIVEPNDTWREVDPTK